MVTTVCESLFASIIPRPELLNLSDFSLDIIAVNDSTVPYIGYCLLELAIPIIGIPSITVPVLVVPKLTD